MFSGGMFQSVPGLRNALTEPESRRRWLEAAQERVRQRMHSADTASLQAEIDQLRLYVEVLFHLLVAQKVFTVEEAQRLMGELEAAASASGGTAGRDPVSGAERPPDENPFREIHSADGVRRVRWIWRWWVRFGLTAVGVLAAGALLCFIVWGRLRGLLP